MTDAEIDALPAVPDMDRAVAEALAIIDTLAKNWWKRPETVGVAA